jgi:hypothetical protein
MCPGRSAARAFASGALQNRDRRAYGAWNGPGSAVHHFVLHRVRDTERYRTTMTVVPTLTRL